MARIELQISSPLFLEAVKHILEERLYSLCFVSPVLGLCLDHVEAGGMGPITQPSSLVPAALNVVMSVKLFPTTADAVKAAQGGPPVFSLQPDGVPLSANFVISISGTKLTAKYDGIVHNDSYSSLEVLVAAFVGGQANAQQLFSRWESALKTALAAISFLSFDLKSILPPQVSQLEIGRSALSADSSIFAARLEVGANGSDGSWQDFEKGSPGDLTGGHDWGLFISGDALVGVINNLVNELVAKAAPGYPFTVNGEFGLLAGSGPLAYSPLEPIAPATASVTTTATIDFTVTLKALGVTVGRDQGSIQLISTLIFTVSNQNTGSHADRFLDISIYWSLQVQNTTSDILGGLIAHIVNLVTQPLGHITLSSGFASGFSATDVPNFFTHQTELPPVVVEKVLTLTVLGCTGTVEPPVSSSVQKQLDSLSTGNQLGWQISPRGSGLLIFGQAELASVKSQPDCGVRSTPFALVMDKVEVEGGDGVWIPVTPENVPAVGSFSVYNMGPHASNRYPLIIGAFIPFSDPTAQWYQTPSLLPKAPRKAANITVTIPEAQFKPAYLEGPYPMSLIVCTNGGARFVSLGKIPVPDIVDGVVENADVSYAEDTSTNPPPTGPQHPVMRNQ
jgi:hypothetical protein